MHLANTSIFFRICDIIFYPFGKMDRNECVEIHYGLLVFGLAQSLWRLGFFWLLSWVWGGKHQQGIHNGFQRIHCNYFFAYYSL